MEIMCELSGFFFQQNLNWWGVRTKRFFVMHLTMETVKFNELKARIEGFFSINLPKFKIAKDFYYFQVELVYLIQMNWNELIQIGTWKWVFFIQLMLVRKPMGNVTKICNLIDLLDVHAINRTVFLTQTNKQWLNMFWDEGLSRPIFIVQCYAMLCMNTICELKFHVLGVLLVPRHDHIITYSHPRNSCCRWL